MKDNIRDQIYEDTLINIKEFSLIRYLRDDHHPSVNPESKSDKNTVHPWPNQYAIDRFHRSNKREYMDALDINDITILPNQFMFVYLLNRSDYKEDKDHPDHTQVDYLRFKHLRNYFMIRRFKLWARHNERVEITLHYRDTFPNQFSDRLVISNTPLIDYIMRHPKRDELTWVVNLEDNPKKFFKIDYTMTDLVFKELQLYFDNPFKLKKKEAINNSANTKGYALTADKNKYHEIADESYNNFKQIVTDIDLYQAVKAHYEKFVTDSN